MRKEEGGGGREGSDQLEGSWTLPGAATTPAGAKTAAGVQEVNDENELGWIFGMVDGSVASVTTDNGMSIRMVL